MVHLHSPVPITRRAFGKGAPAAAGAATAGLPIRRASAATGGKYMGWQGYDGHFKCNRRRIADYPNLSGYLRDLTQWPGVAPTCSLEHVKRHYYASHWVIIPTGIVPKGPALNLNSPHSRDRF